MFLDDHSKDAPTKPSRLQITDSSGHELNFDISNGFTYERDYEMGALRVETSGPIVGLVNNDTEANKAIQEVVTRIRAIDPEDSAYLMGMQHTAEMIAWIMAAKQAGTLTINH